MIAVLDFDDTIFDTCSLKKELEIIFNDCLGNDYFASSYKAIRAKGNYSPQLQIDELEKEGKADPRSINEIKTRVKELFKEIDRFIFPEAKELLEFLQKNKYEIYLLTLGDKEFQKNKVSGSELIKQFIPEDNIYYEEKSKEENKLLLELKERNEKFLYINDKECECEEAKKAFGDKCLPVVIYAKKEGSREQSETRRTRLGELTNFLKVENIYKEFRINK